MIVVPDPERLGPSFLRRGNMIDLLAKDTAGNYLPGFLTSPELAKLLALSPKRVAVHFSVSWMIRTYECAVENADSRNVP
jgi:hypothetical protein